MEQKMVVGDIEAEKGTRTCGYLKVAETATRMIRIPIVLINGSRPGKTLGLLGGTHGLEYSSMAAVIEATRNIDPKELRGAVVAVTCVSEPVFEASGNRLETTAFLSKIDSQNQNRTFVSEKEWEKKRLEGYTMSFRIADKLCNEVFPKLDYMVDCHGGDLPEDLGDFVILTPTDNKEIESSQKMMAECFNSEIVLMLDLKDSTVHFCNEVLGIPAIVPESGMGYNLHMERARFHYDGIRNLMKRLKMIPGNPKTTPLPKQKKDFESLGVSLYAKHGGLFFPKVGLGMPLSEGQTLGEIRNIFGEKIETLTWAPPEKDRIYKTSSRRVPFPVNAGDLLFIIQGIPKEYSRRFEQRHYSYWCTSCTKGY